MKLAAHTLLADLATRTRANLDAARQFEGLSDQVLNYKTSPDSWSILECIEHLNRYGDFYLPEINRRLAAAPLVAAPKTPANNLFKSGWLGNYFAENMLPKEKLNKMKTFKKMNPAGSRLSRKVLQKFIEQQQQILDLLARASQADLSRTKTYISISKLIKLRLGDALRVVIYHNQRHILQAQKVLLQIEATAVHTASAVKH